MGALNDVYEVIDVQNLAGQEVLNVYFYRQNTIVGTSDAEDLADAFVDDILPGIRAVQTPDVLHTEIRVRNLFNESDRFIMAISLAGTHVAGDYQNNFSAVGFSLIQDNGAVKNGAKRVASLPDAAITDGIITETVTIASLVALGGLMSGDLTTAALDVFIPTIVKRILVSPGVYRLPDNFAEAVLGSVVDAIFNPFITSQVSRKIGVGV